MIGAVVDGGLFTSGTTDVVLGIDQSYTGFGVTAMASTGKPVYHSWLYRSSGTGVRRVISIRTFLDSIQVRLRSCRVTEVAMEGYAPGARYGREQAGELGGMVKIWFWEHYQIEPLQVAPTSLKKYVTGKGTKVLKNQILLQVYKKWGVEYHDDNLADSYGLARIASGRHDTGYESEVLQRVTR